MPQANQTKQRFYYGLIIGLVCLGLLTGWAVRSFSRPQAVAPESQLVSIMKVQSAGAGQEYTYSGEVRGRYESQLAFQASGKIVRRNVDLGSTVSAGAVLMQIDPADIQQAVAGRKAQLLAAQSQYQLAKDNLNRFKQLYQKDFMSKAEFDRYQNAYDAADAALSQAQAQYSQGLNQLRYCNLYADSAGVIMAVNAEIGQVVAAGQPVVTIVQGGEREIEINVPENRLTNLSSGERLKVTFWALPGVTAEGRVREVAPMADKITRTYRVRVSLSDPPPGLKLGMTATVVEPAAATSQATVFIPISAIYQTGADPAVWLVRNGRVSLRRVKTGQFGDNQVAILAGLTDGDVIVTAGVHKLRPGEKVRTGDEL